MEQRKLINTDDTGNEVSHFGRRGMQILKGRCLTNLSGALNWCYQYEPTAIEL
jgi:hypothetical protein